MDAHRVDILDGADDDAVIGLVADHLHLELFPAEYAFFDEHLGGGGKVQAMSDDLAEFFEIIGNTATGSGEGEGGAHNGGQADKLQTLQGLAHIVSGFGFRAFETELIHGIAEFLAIFGLVDDIGLGTDHLNAVLCERTGCF